MTPQEQQMIQSLTDRINNTPLAEKDSDAERFLQQALGRNPDALYILAQTTLVQQYALEQAQKQLADLRAQLDQQRQLASEPKHSTSFLGSLLGHHDDPPPPRSNVPPQYAPGYGGQPGGYMSPPPPYEQPQYAQPQYGQPQFVQPQYGQAPYAQPQSGGFLRSAMQTATGVAAGALAFEGIESLMHGFGGGSGDRGFGGGGIGGGMGGGRPEEVINNNYYGDSGSGGRDEHMSSDIEDRRGGSSFSDAVDRDDHNYQAGLADTGANDSDANDADSNDLDTSDPNSDDSLNFDDDSSGGDDSSSNFGDDSN